MRKTSSLVAVYGGALMQGLTVVSFPASGAVLRAMHGLSDAQYGALFLPQTAMTIVGSVLAGGLARSLGLPALARLALAASGLAEAVLAATMALGPGPAYAALLVAIGLAGLGFGLSAAPLNTYPGVLFPARREPELVVLHTALGAGFAAGPLIAGVATDAGHWGAFPILLALGAAALAAVRLPPAPATAPAATRAGAPTTQLAFWSLAAVAVVYALCEGTFASWIVIYLEEERGVAAASAALALSTFWAALVLGRLTVGFAARRFADHVAWVSSMLTAALMLGVGAGAFVLGALRQMTSLAGLYRWSSLYAAVLLALVLVVTRLPRRSAAQPARLTALPKGEMP